MAYSTTGFDARISLMQKAADHEQAVLGLAALSGMPFDWCAQAVAAEYVESAMAIPPVEVARRMGSACAFGACSLEQRPLEMIRWSFTGYRWW